MKHAITLLKQSKKEKEEDSVSVCLKKRKIKTCQQCCRYDECYNNKPIGEGWSLQSMVRLGNAIVESIGADYCKAWKSGNANQLNYYRQVLHSTYPDILTANQTNGVALEETLAKKCRQYYGEFESCKATKSNRLKGQIKDQKQLLNDTTDIHKRKHIRNKIYRLEGELND